MKKISDEDILQDLTSKLREYLDQQKQLDELVKKTRIAIDLYSKPHSSSNGEVSISLDNFDYPDDASWKERVVTYLKYVGKGSTSSQISKAISAIEKRLNASQVANMVSAALSELQKKNEIKTYKPGKMKGYYYCSPLWFDVDDNLMERYKPEKEKYTIW